MATHRLGLCQRTEQGTDWGTSVRLVVLLECFGSPWCGCSQASSLPWTIPRRS